MPRTKGALGTFTAKQVESDQVIEVEAIPVPVERTETGKFAAGRSGNPAGRPKGSGKKLNEALGTILYEEGGAELIARRAYAAAINKRNPSIALQAMKFIGDRVEPVKQEIQVTKQLDPATMERLAEAYELYLEHKGMKDTKRLAE